MNKERDRETTNTSLHAHSTHKLLPLFVLKTEQFDKSQMLVRSKYLHVLIGLINDRDMKGGGEGGEVSDYLNIHH